MITKLSLYLQTVLRKKKINVFLESHSDSKLSCHLELLHRRKEIIHLTSLHRLAYGLMIRLILDWWANYMTTMITSRLKDGICASCLTHRNFLRVLLSFHILAV